MSDNVVKFRPIKKEPEPKPPRKPMPGWMTWLVFFALAFVIYGAQQAGLLG
ncbi:hypothetical protein [Devosia sp. 2618]|uniref:hypothetical protein n=1 Tax=Devosia sp. 2618 TaxID=3156454 RepID=UPI003394E03D